MPSINRATISQEKRHTAREWLHLWELTVAKMCLFRYTGTHTEGECCKVRFHAFRSGLLLGEVSVKWCFATAAPSSSVSHRIISSFSVQAQKSSFIPLSSFHCQRKWTNHYQTSVWDKTTYKAYTPRTWWDIYRCHSSMSDLEITAYIGADPHQANSQKKEATQLRRVSS